uniref:Uncharacterized protein n=1 Tax=Arundo donax TaxID=35708 RepID=A0A0A9HFU7_ARUDO
MKTIVEICMNNPPNRWN